MHDIIFFNVLIIPSAGSLLAYQNILCGKNTYYPLTTTKGDRFASCENIVSRSQTSSLPPPRPHYTIREPGTG